MFTKTTCTALAALAVLGFAANSHAAPATSSSPDTDALSMTVSVGDLGAGGESAAKALLQRVYNAARDVCAEETSPLACRDDTVARAVASLNNPAVTALNAGRRPTTVLATSGR